MPGLKVCFPATPYDAKGLMAAALEDDNPVVFFESQRIYGQSEIFHPEGVPEEYYTIPIGLPEVKVPGEDLTILTFGATLYRAHEAVQMFKEQHDISVELIDGRSLVPFDYEPVIESVKKTGRLIVSSDACERGSYLHNVASMVGQLAFDYLDAPVVTIGSRNWITPAAELDESFFPQPSWFVDAFSQQIMPLEGRSGDRWTKKRLEESKKGI
jgi:2-oxoisovalerate dehydrogenase E1 component